MRKNLGAGVKSSIRYRETNELELGWEGECWAEHSQQTPLDLNHWLLIVLLPETQDLGIKYTGHLLVFLKECSSS